MATCQLTKSESKELPLDYSVGMGVKITRIRPCMATCFCKLPKFTVMDCEGRLLSYKWQKSCMVVEIASGKAHA